MSLYAFAKFLSIEFKKELLFYIDRNYYSSKSDFNYIDFALDKFQIELKTIDKFLNPFELKLSKYYFTRHFLSKTVWNRKYWEINKTLPKRLFLNDCSGNQELFDRIKVNLNKDFTLKDKYLNMIDKLYIKKIKVSIGIHIRGGDYISKFSNIYYIPNRQYYINAVKKVNSDAGHQDIYIFTNEHSYVKSLDLPFNYEMIHDDYKDYQQFYLLSQCKHKIIANSGFSWWAAWLNSESGMVIRPKYYFNPTNNLYSNETVFYPDKWQMVE